MNKAAVLAFLDGEIERLKEARELLSGGNSLGERRNGRGMSRVASRGKRKRHLSAEARRRISEAQKKRWAARKKAGH